LSAGDITKLLKRIADGEEGAKNDLLQTVYDDLHFQANRLMSNERAGHLLQPSALINEAFMRLDGNVFKEARDRRYFFAAAAKAMRRILVDWAKTENALKKGGEWTKIPLDSKLLGLAQADFNIVDVDLAVQKLAEVNVQLAEVVELRYFGGLDVQEVADVGGVSKSKIEKDLKKALAFLRLKVDEQQ
jgi:RNA polymerase sigma-70 factor, ECF subfamily